MPDNKNLAGRRINPEALERILKRASELQAGEVDTTQDLTEAELLKLGSEVGIDGRHLRQALYEEASGPADTERGVASRWFGPGIVRASRVVRGERQAIEEQLFHWMTEGELLAVKRRMPDRMLFERQKGFVAEMKRGFGVGGRSYHLAKAKEVSFAVTSLEAGYCHVELAADLSDARGAAIGGSLFGGALVASTGVVLLAISAHASLLLEMVAAIPVATGASVPWLFGRGMIKRAEQAQLSLEQVLDRLEHGEIQPRNRSNTPSSAMMRVADEIRRALTDGIEQSKRPRRLGP